MVEVKAGSAGDEYVCFPTAIQDDALAVPAMSSALASVGREDACYVRF